MRPVIGVLVGTLSAATLLAQAPPAAQDTPTFRSGVQLIEVDVVVTGRDGKPVRGLTRDDFEIVEDNKPQEIRTFSIIDLPSELPAALAALRGGVEPDVVTNTAPEGRTYVLLLDTPTENLRARHLAEQWLNEVVQATDRVAVVNVRGAYNDAQSFTGSRHLILNAINRMIRGGGAASDMKAEVTRELDRWRAVKDISERLGTVAARRKAIVWIADPPPILHPQTRSRPINPNHPADPEDPVAQSAAVLLSAWREAAQAAVNNNVAIYPVDPDGLTTDFGGLDGIASMREIAEETGGVAVGVNSNEFSRGFATIVQDASTYYLLGYSPVRELTDGKFHPIEVRVKRPDVNVRARRGYYAAPPGAALAPKKPPPTPPEGVSLAARDALRKPVATAGLGVDVATTVFKGNGKDASVVITAHVRGKTLELDKGRRLAVSYQVFDVEGKLATGFYKVFGFNLGNESKARATGTGLQFVERISLKPGRYELRLVAEQLAPSGVEGQGGPIGSVVAPIEAGKFEEELELSGVALASRRANEVLLVGDRSLRGVLSSDASALRTFRAGDGLSAYVEVYTRLDDSNSGIRPEFINVATLTSAITNSAGAIVVRGKAQKAGGEAAGKSLREGFRTDFDLSKLTPGSYVLTLEARAGRDLKRTASRQIPFTIE